MELAEDELRDLAVFCARRFPGPAEQAQLAARVGVAFVPHEDPVQAWVGLLRDAQEADALGRLARALAAAAPEDRNLQEAAAVLVTGDRAVFSRAPVIFVAALLVGAVLAGAWWWQAEPGLREVAAAPTGTSSGLAAPSASVPSPAAPSPAVPSPAAPSPDPAAPAAEAVAPSPAPPSPAAPSPAAPAPEAVSAAPVASAPPPAPPAPPAEPPPVVAPAVAVAAVTPTPAAAPALGCAGPPGEIVGYWYAGAAFPGAPGQVVTLDRDARVRADYPRAENQHDARAAERCVLKAGTRVTLSHAPIDASKGHWWVPFAAGDAG